MKDVRYAKQLLDCRPFRKIKYRRTSKCLLDGYNHRAETGHLLAYLHDQNKKNYVIYIHLNFARFFKSVLAVTEQWFYPTFWWHTVYKHLVFTSFTSRPTPLPACNEVYVFFFLMCMFSPNILLTWHRSGADAFHSVPVSPHFLVPSWYHIIVLFRSFWIVNASDV